MRSSKDSDLLSFHLRMIVQMMRIAPTEAAIAIRIVMTILPVFDMELPVPLDSVGSAAATVVLVMKVVGTPPGIDVVGILGGRVGVWVGCEDSDREDEDLVLEDVTELAELVGRAVVDGAATTEEAGGEATIRLELDKLEGGMDEVTDDDVVTPVVTGGRIWGERFLTMRLRMLWSRR